MIPKTIFQTWESHDINPEMKKIINSWKKQNPEYKYFLYDNKQREAFLSSNFPPYVIESYRKIKPGPFKADLWRYCILYIYGGFYADIDTLCLDNIDKYIDDTTEFISVVDLYIHPDKHNLSNGFIGAKPKHPILNTCIEAICEDVKNNSLSNKGMNFSGPGCLGIATNKYLNLSNYSSFRCKEGKIEKNIILLKFHNGNEYITDNNNNILFQNKNGNQEIINSYKILTEKHGIMCDWSKFYWNGTLR